MAAAEVVKPAQQTALAPATVLEVIAAALHDPRIDPERLSKLLDFQERIEAKKAEVAYNKAMSACQAEIGPIVRDAENTQQHSMYARLETIDQRARPIYTRHGFALSYGTLPSTRPGAANVSCELRHSDGHKTVWSLEGDLDTAGPQGKANKTAIQGLGSTVSYLRRYLMCMIFNIVLANEDRDGVAGLAPVTEEQASQLYDMLNALELNEKGIRAFLAFARAESVEKIQARVFPEIMARLKEKLADKRRMA